MAKNCFTIDRQEYWAQFEIRIDLANILLTKVYQTKYFEIWWTNAKIPEISCIQKSALEPKLESNY